jgi:hypothetical protein
VFYDFRWRPGGTQLASFEVAPRSVTLYPGNVSELDWDVEPLFILFGRAVGADGRAIANVDIVGPHGIGRTDGDGYFQIETYGNDELRLDLGRGAGCTMKVAAANPVNGLVSAGDLACR